MFIRFTSSDYIMTKCIIMTADMSFKQTDILLLFLGLSVLFKTHKDIQDKR